jgi:hypothetical protein
MVNTTGRLLLVVLETIVDDKRGFVNIQVSLLSLFIFKLPGWGLQFGLRALGGLAGLTFFKFILIAVQLFILIQKAFLKFIVSLRVVL